MQLTNNTIFHNRFRLIEKKGSGSYGEVWLAHDEQLDDMEVAVKVYIALDRQGLDVFKSEYNATLGLNHPNLLCVYHLGFCDNRPYLVMPYCPYSAAMLIGKSSESTLWHFIHDVASGLDYLHENGFVHNNLKPDNVLVDRQNHFVITDYGITPRLHDVLQQNWERENSLVLAGGAPIYKAPEWFQSLDSAVYATDIWALGASLYEMASGDVPLYGMGGVALLNGGKINRPQWSYSESLFDTILQCLAKETWERPRAKELVERAQNVIDRHPFNSVGKEDMYYNNNKHDNNPEDSKPQPKNTTTKKNKVKVLGLILVALLLGSVGFLGWKLTQETSDKANDNFMFQNCKTGSDYRAYMKRYPNGVNFELAKSRLEEWVRDSISQSNSIMCTDGSKQPVEQPSDNLKENLIDNKKENKQEEAGKGKDGTKKSTNEDMEKPKSKDSKQVFNGNDKLTLSNNPNKAEPNQHSGLTKAPDNPDLEPDEPGLKAVVGIEQGQSTSSSSEEEAYQRAIASNATLEDCLYWMEQYGNQNNLDKDKWNKVKGKFWQLYNHKLRECKTIHDCEQFLKEHDGIMKRARQAGTPADERTKSRAEDKKKHLENRS